MTGLRERKKEQTRRRIAAAALRLFAERGFDAVTVNEIAEAAEVSKVTLFAYFPTKESLVLHGIGEEDLAGIVAGRPPDRSPLDALRASFHALAADPALPPTPEETEALVTRVRVIFGSPALTTAASALLHRQREALAAALSTEYDELTAALMAAQISAAVQTVQEVFLRRLADGMPLGEAARRLADDVELAFDLLAGGLPDTGNRPPREGGR